jgi:hypothetical protein
MKVDLLWCEKCQDLDESCPHCHDAMGNKTSASVWRGKGYREADRAIEKWNRNRKGRS